MIVNVHTSNGEIPIVCDEKYIQQDNFILKKDNKVIAQFNWANIEGWIIAHREDYDVTSSCSNCKYESQCDEPATVCGEYLRK